MRFFKRNPKERFAPSLIDLIKYEKDLLYQREHNIPRMPPPMAAEIRSDWTDSERQAIYDNRDRAQALYEKYRR